MMRKRIFTTAVVLFSLHLPGLVEASSPGPTGQTPITDISYKYNIEPPCDYKDRGDPGHDELLNGILEDGDHAPIWPKGTFQPVVITFDLKRRYTITRIEAVGCHGSAGFCFHKLTAALEDETGGFQNVGEDDSGPQGGQPAVGQVVLKVDKINKPALRIRLTLYPEGQHMMLQEVRIFGKPIVSQRKSVSSNPSSNKQGGYLLPELADSETLVAEEGDFDQDGKTEIRLENEYLRLVIDPYAGGRVGSWVYKPTGHDFTNRPDAGVDGGMIGDHVWQQGYWGDWVEAEYTWEIERSQDAITVHQHCPGKTGALAFIIFNKSITLRRGSAAVQVDYKIDNDPRSVTGSLTYGFWFHNCAIGSSGKRLFFFPGELGVQEVDVDRLGEADIWMNGPARGWAGALAADSKSGLTVTIDYRYYKLFYSWVRNIVVPTFEWRFYPVRIESGQSFQTSFSFLAFSGLSLISGAGDKVAGSLVVRGQPAVGQPVTLETSVVADRARSAELVLNLRRLPDGESQQIGRSTVQIPPAATADHVFQFVPSEPGTYAATVTVMVEGQKACELEAPLAVGKPSAPYSLIPEGPQLSGDMEAGKQINIDPTDKVVTPHINWAKPYAGKRPRALILVMGRAQREVIELSQRMDIVVDTSFMAGRSPDEEFGDYYYKGMSEEFITKRANALFASAQPYDVVVLSGPVWKRLGDFARTRLREWVAAGCGLICVDPAANSEADWQLLPVEPQEGASWLQWDLPKRNHPALIGAPLAQLPMSSFRSLTAKKEADVLATAGGGRTPAVVAGAHGKGRVLVLGYNTQDRTYMVQSALTPSYFSCPQKTFGLDYWEYYYSLLAKAILWATHNTTALTIAEIKPPDSFDLSLTQATDVQLQLQCTQAQSARIVAQVHQGLGPRLTVFEQKCCVSDGSQQITVSIPADKLLHGSNLVDVWIYNADDEVLDWASTVIKAGSPVYVSSVELAKATFDYAELVTGSVNVHNSSDSADTWLRLSVTDPQGRILWQKQYAGQSGTCSFSADLGQPLFSPHGLLAETGRGSRTLSRVENQFLVRLDRTWDDFDACIWGSGSGRDAKIYYTPTVAQNLRKMGFTSVIINPGDWNSQYVSAMLAAGLRLVAKGGGWSLTPPVEGSDKDRPIRSQSPIEDKYIAYALNDGKGYGYYGRQYGILDAIAGDENSWGEDWAPDYLKKFRIWLKEQYTDIDSLNAQWQSDFTDFESVMPLTAEQAREQRRFAGWVDFRTFDAYALTSYLGNMRKGLHEIDPQGRLSVSGTWDPKATGGADWVYLLANVDVVRNYGTYQHALVRSLAPGVIGARWAAGYGVSDPYLRWYLWHWMLEGQRGISACAERQLLNPDLTWSNSATVTSRELIPMSRGIGKALINSRRDNGQILLHYSHPSHSVAWLLRMEDSLKNTREGIVRAIHEYGTSYNFISSAQIEAGRLRQGNARLLILTHSFALSDQEAEEIKQFVAAGGVVLADLAPGIATAHGRLRESGALDDLFGVDRRAAEFDLRKGQLKGAAPISEVGFSGTVEATARETHVVATDAGSAATDIATRTPGMFVRAYQKGLAILLNSDCFASYLAAAEGRQFPQYASRAQSLEALVFSIIRRAGIEPFALFEAEDGQDLSCKYLARFEADRTTYLGFCHGDFDNTRADSAPEMVVLKLGQRCYVYDVFADHSYGLTDEIRFPMPWNFAHVWAFLPYQVHGLQADMPTASKAGEILQFNLRVLAGETCGDHVVRMEVFAPDGKQRCYLSQNILAKQGQAAVSLPFALNVPLGNWKISFLDITSGQRLEQEITLN